MSERFIKLMLTEKTQWILKNYPSAFLLLTQIAQRARRDFGGIDGLQPGDALIGDYANAGLSRQEYRTAIKKLVELQIVKIISNGKKFIEREKSTIKSTIKGMLVNIIDSTVYDINQETINQHVNQQSTNDQPTINHKQEGIKKEIRKNKNILLKPVESKTEITSDNIYYVALSQIFQGSLAIYYYSSLFLCILVLLCLFFVSILSQLLSHTAENMIWKSLIL